MLDDEPSNNIYPPVGAHHIIRSQYEYAPILTRHIDPPNNSITSLGSTVNITVGLINDGLVDISQTTGIYLRTRIYKSNNGIKTGNAVFDYTYLAERGSMDKEEVRIPCMNAATKEPNG